MKTLLALGLGLTLLVPASAQLEPPNEAGVTMGHLHLNVRDMEKSRKFWVDHFGAVAFTTKGLQGVKIPGMLIVFRQVAPTGGTVGTVLDHVSLRVRDLAGTLKSLRAAGYEIPREFKGSGGSHNAYVNGPDDLKLELQEDASLKVAAASHRLHYYVRDPAALRDWYVKTFSFTAGVQSANLPGMNLSFEPNDPQPPSGTKGRALDHIGFEIRNLEAFCKKLEASGVKIDVPYRKIPNVLAYAFITDPQGVYIELSEGLDTF